VEETIQLATQEKQPKTAGYVYRKEQDSEADEIVKRQQRVRIMKFIKDYNQPVNGLRRFAGLPSKEWAFERKLQELYQGACSYVGFENDWRITKWCDRYMPASQPQNLNYKHFDLTTDEENKKPQGRKNANCFGAFYTDQSVLLYDDIEKIILYDSESFVDEAAQCWFDERCRGWTMAWLDLMCCTSQILEKCLRSLEAWLHPEAKVVPIAITIFKGHDRNANKFHLVSEDGCKVGQRRDWMLDVFKANKEFDVSSVDCWGYESAEGGPMASYEFLLTR